MSFFFIPLSELIDQSCLFCASPDNMDRKPLRDGPLQKLWGGGEGNFRAAGNFFRYQIPCMNFFSGPCMNIS